MMLFAPCVVVVGGSERKHSDWRPEICDSCLLTTLYLPDGGQTILDQAESEGDRSAALCVKCSVAVFGRDATVKMLCEQKEAWE